MIEIANLLLKRDLSGAAKRAESEYPFNVAQSVYRKITKKESLAVFIRDGFIDRYSGEKLYHPAFLRILSVLLPEQFPFQSHGKKGLCHDIFWDKMPSIDHITPVFAGGKDEFDNWITTSMRRNLAKSNSKLLDLGWTIREPGDFRDWDGCTARFLDLYDKFKPTGDYLKTWYNITGKAIGRQ